MTPPTKALLKSLLYGLLLVAVLSGCGLAVAAFHYPLFPGIALAGLIFSNDVDSDHRLRFEVAAVVFNTLLYGLALFALFFRPRTPAAEAPRRIRRTPGRLQ